jgi:hypothetical protein
MPGVWIGALVGNEMGQQMAQGKGLVSALLMGLSGPFCLVVFWVVLITAGLGGYALARWLWRDYQSPTPWVWAAACLMWLAHFPLAVDKPWSAIGVAVCLGMSGLWWRPWQRVLKTLMIGPLWPLVWLQVGFDLNGKCNPDNGCCTRAKALVAWWRAA